MTEVTSVPASSTPGTACAPDITQVPAWRWAKAFLPLRSCANFSVIHSSSVLNNAINVTLMSNTQFTARLPAALIGRWGWDTVMLRRCRRVSLTPVSHLTVALSLSVLPEVVISLKIWLSHKLLLLVRPFALTYMGAGVTETLSFVSSPQQKNRIQSAAPGGLQLMELNDWMLAEPPPPHHHHPSVCQPCPGCPAHLSQGSSKQKRTSPPTTPPPAS